MQIWSRRLASKAFCAQAALAGGDFQRQRAFRIGTLSLLLFAYLIIGETGAAAAFAVGLVVMAGGEAILLRRLEAADQVSGRPAFLMIGFIGLSTLFHLGFGLQMATHPATPVALAGFVWIMTGIMQACLTDEAALPVRRASLLPAVALTLVFPLFLGWSDPRPPTLLEWLLPLALLPALLQTCHGIADAAQAAFHEAERRASDRLEALEHSANHDKLTGLMNRAAFDQLLHKTLGSKRRMERQPALFLLDLNDFKPINDTYGHGAGDVILRAVAERIVTVIRNDGHAARIGGDEFAVLLPDIAHIEDAELVAQRLVETVAEHIACAERVLSVGVSIGVALQRDVGRTPAELLAAADKAMYRAKTDKGCGFAVYDRQLDAPRFTVEETVELEEALRRGQIVPYFQPKVDLESRELIGFEALARWEHPTRGLLPPSEFLPKIEQLGLQGEFTYRIARRVFSQVNNLVALGLDPGQVAINISEISLATASGRQDIEWLFAENPKSINHITIEITENVFIARAGDVMQDSVRKLRELGVRISLDDFGTGFASFQHLRQLEFDELKIDTEFVAGLGTDPVSDVIVDGFISIATGLGVDVVAEGVETETQLEFLLQRGCRIGQGYLFSPAVCIEEMTGQLTAAARRPSGSIVKNR